MLHLNYPSEALETRSSLLLAIPVHRTVHQSVLSLIQRAILPSYHRLFDFNSVLRPQTSNQRSNLNKTVELSHSSSLERNNLRQSMLFLDEFEPTIINIAKPMIYAKQLEPFLYDKILKNILKAVTVVDSSNTRRFRQPNDVRPVDLQ